MHDHQLVFDRIYREHIRALHSFLIGKTGNPQVALDLLQDTFLRVWRSIQRTADLKSEQLGPWVFSIARNLLIDYYRNQARESVKEKAIGQRAREMPLPESDAQTVLAAKEQLALADAAIRDLPDDQRTVLLMTVVGEMSSTKIAQLLEVPAGTVRYKLSLARRTLVEKLRLHETMENSRQV